jgi:DNA repair exonuclease SbcCD nuclease subunit
MRGKEDNAMSASIWGRNTPNHSVPSPRVGGHSGDLPDAPDPYGDTLAGVRAIKKSSAAPVGIVVTGDNHLGGGLSGLAPERRAQRHEVLRRTFAAAVDYAIERGARLFVLTGDLFDSPAPSTAEQAFVAGELARLRRANIVCVGVSGSADTPHTEAGAESPMRMYAALEGMHYFPPGPAISPRLVVIGDLRLALAGISSAPGGAGDPLADVSFVDPDRVLTRADIGLFIMHAPVEGLAPSADSAAPLTRASAQSLPRIFRVIVAGHGHHFGRTRIGEREVIAPGATERMDFETEAGSAGFAWLEVVPDGLTRVKRVTLAEQPRADLELTTERLFPGALAAAANEDAHATQGEAANAALGVVRAALDSVATEDTLVRLRLTGPLTREQYRRLPLPEIVQYGSRHAFAFELDTTGLVVVDTAREPAVAYAGVKTGPISPTLEVERLLKERLARLPTDDDEAAEDARAAAAILLARLRTSAGRSGPLSAGGGGRTDREVEQ